MSEGRFEVEHVRKIRERKLAREEERARSERLLIDKQRRRYERQIAEEWRRSQDRNIGWVIAGWVLAGVTAFGLLAIWSPSLGEASSGEARTGSAGSYQASTTAGDVDTNSAGSKQASTTAGDVDTNSAGSNQATTTASDVDTNSASSNQASTTGIGDCQYAISAYENAYDEYADAYGALEAAGGLSGTLEETTAMPEWDVYTTADNRVYDFGTEMYEKCNGPEDQAAAESADDAKRDAFYKRFG